MKNKTKYKHLWNATKAVFRGKFIALYVFIRKKGRPKISNLSFHLRKLAKEKLSLKCQKKTNNLSQSRNQ